MLAAGMPYADCNFLYVFVRYRYAALMTPCDQQMTALKHSADALAVVLRMDPAFEKRAEIYYRWMPNSHLHDDSVRGW